MSVVGMSNTGYATSSKGGMMSAADKRKLDGIPEGAQAYDNATRDTDGLQSKEDKSKLDGIESGAQVNTITGIKGAAEDHFRTGEVNITADNVGAADKDHTHPLASKDTDGMMSKEIFSKIEDMQTSLAGYPVQKDDHGFYLRMDSEPSLQTGYGVKKDSEGYYVEIT